MCVLRLKALMYVLRLKALMSFDESYERGTDMIFSNKHLAETCGLIREMATDVVPRMLRGDLVK